MTGDPSAAERCAAARTTRLALGVILAVAAVLLFARLGQRAMWQDEAQTALLARTTLRGGVPRGTDGLNSFSQELGADYGPGYVWRWHPWLPFYLVAASFRALGESTFAARMPFALLGLATVALIYAYAKAAWRSERTALIAAALLTGCVPFLLLARQCRYYAAAALFSLLGLHAYAGIRARKRGATPGLVLAATLLFHLHYVYCAALLATALLHSALRDRSAFWRSFVASAVTSTFALPWVIWIAGMTYSTQYGGAVRGVGTTLENLGSFVAALVTSTLPLAFLLAVGVIVAARRRARATLEWGPRDAYEVPALFLAVTLCGLALTSLAPFYRYLAPLIPVFCLLLARLSELAASAHRAAPLGLAILFVASGPAAGLGYELTHDYEGPVAGIVSYLKANAHAGQTVAITYEDLPVAFYTPLRVVGGLTGADLAPAFDADFVVLRKNTVCDKDAEVAKALREHVAWSNYEPVELDAPDTRFDNREALDDGLAWFVAGNGHPFWTQTAAPHVTVWRRVRN